MTTTPPGPPREGRAVVVYTALRVLLFLGCVLLGWLAGLDGLLLLVVALVVSGVLSWFLLQRQRLAMGSSVDSAMQRARNRLRARSAAEDAYVDGLHRDDESR